MKNTKLEEIAKRHGARDVDWLSETTVEVTFQRSHDRARAVREMKDHPWYRNCFVDPDSTMEAAMIFLVEREAK